VQNSVVSVHNDPLWRSAHSFAVISIKIGINDAPSLTRDGIEITLARKPSALCAESALNSIAEEIADFAGKSVEKHRKIH
jgi:hypothetical protein